MEEKKSKKKFIIIGIIAALIIAAGVVFFVINANTIKDKRFIGTWTTDGYTKYRFKRNSTGALIVSNLEYKFDYSVNENKVTIDFRNKDSQDMEYRYTFDKNKLVLEGINGVFVFKKISKK